MRVKPFLYAALLVGAILLCSSCNREMEYKEICYQDDFTMTAPAFMDDIVTDSATNSMTLTSKALRMMMTLRKEQCDTVRSIYAQKEMGFEGAVLENIGETIITGFLGNFESIESMELCDTIIDALPAQIYYVCGKIQGSKLRFVAAFIEDNEELYQISMIMPYKKGDTQLEILNKMIYSWHRI